MRSVAGSTDNVLPRQAILLTVQIRFASAGVCTPTMTKQNCFSLAQMLAQSPAGPMTNLTGVCKPECVISLFAVQAHALTYYSVEVQSIGKDSEPEPKLRIAAASLCSVRLERDRKIVGGFPFRAAGPLAAAASCRRVLSQPPAQRSSLTKPSCT